MSRKKNLLEAFQRSESASASSAGAGSPAASSGASAGAGSGSSMPLFERSSSPRGALSRAGRPLAALAVVGVVLAFVLGFVLGRGSSGETRAEEKPDPSVAGEPQTPPSNQPRSFQERGAPGEGAAQVAQDAGSALPPRLEDSALYDRRNTSTVVVAAYSKSNQDLAWATYEHLRDARLQVFPPIASKNLVVVLVGAAPKESDLEATKNAVRAQTRNGKRAYEDAYVARIDTLIPRPTTNESQNP